MFPVPKIGHTHPPLLYFLFRGGLAGLLPLMFPVPGESHRDFSLWLFQEGFWCHSHQSGCKNPKCFLDLFLFWVPPCSFLLGFWESRICPFGVGYSKSFLVLVLLFLVMLLSFQLCQLCHFSPSFGHKSLIQASWAVWVFVMNWRNHMTEKNLQTCE